MNDDMKSSQSPDDELVELFIEARSGDSSAQARLDERLRASAQDRLLLGQLTRMWDDIGALPAPPLRSETAGKAYGHGLFARFRMPVAFAAGIATLIATPLFFGFVPFGEKTVQTVQFTAQEGNRTVNLADGSTMVLAAGSSARVTLEDRQRAIKLDQGEAYFKVAHDPDRPFLVATTLGQARAVGTAFSVRRDNADAVVTVTEGIVQVSTASHAAQQRVTAGQQVRFDAGRVSLPRQIDPISEISWTNGTLRFDGTPLGEVLTVFNRHSKRKITLRDQRLAAIPIFAILRTDDVEGVVTIIRSQSNLNAEAFTRVINVDQAD